MPEQSTLAVRKKTAAKTTRDVANAIAAEIAALPAKASLDQVLCVMKNQQCSKQMLADAFWILDTQPGRFANQNAWHPLLRSLRNHPIDGLSMFALFA